MNEAKERDCLHGRQVGKCADCDIETLEVENRMMRERNERMQQQLDRLFNTWPGGVEEIEACFDSLQSELAVAQEERRIAIKAYRELLLKYDRLEERIQK